MGTGQSYLNQLVDRVVRADEGSRARSVKDRLFLSGTNMRLLDHRDDAELDEADEMEFGPAVELGSRHLATRRPPPSHRETDENEDLAWHIPIRDLYRHGAGKAQNRYRAQVQRVDAWLVKRGYLPTPEADQGRSEGNPHPGALRIQGARAAGLWQPNTGRVQPLPGSVIIFENLSKAGRLDGRVCWGRTFERPWCCAISARTRWRCWSLSASGRSMLSGCGGGDPAAVQCRCRGLRGGFCRDRQQWQRPRRERRSNS